MRTGTANPESATIPESTTTTQSMTTFTTGADTPKTLSELEDEKANLRKALSRAGNAFFSTYEMTLAGDPKHVWEKIVREQTESAPYTDVRGVEHAKKAGKTPDSFQECIRFHLQSVFKYDSGEHLRTYLSFVVGKPARVKVRQFVHS